MAVLFFEIVELSQIDARTTNNKEKIYLHVNAQQHSVWMWESGKIDDAAQAIGKLI
jgi:hypothetical protein